MRAVLKHRADLSRATITNVDGKPVTTFTPVATAIPVFLDPSDGPQESAQATFAQNTEARRTGTLLTAPETQILPNDRLTISIPGAPDSTWTASDFPSLVATPYGASHRAHKVREA